MIKSVLRHKCGCIVEATLMEITGESKYHKVAYNITRWNLKSYCAMHQPNYSKKADKVVRKKEKKRGKGYTK